MVVFQASVMRAEGGEPCKAPCQGRVRGPLPATQAPRALVSHLCRRPHAPSRTPRALSTPAPRAPTGPRLPGLTPKPPRCSSQLQEQGSWVYVSKATILQAGCDATKAAEAGSVRAGPAGRWTGRARGTAAGSELLARCPP